MVLIEGSSAGGGCRVWRGGEGRGKGICTCVEGEGGNRCVWRGRGETGVCGGGGGKQVCVEGEG